VRAVCNLVAVAALPEQAEAVVAVAALPVIDIPQVPVFSTNCAQFPQEVVAPER